MAAHGRWVWVLFVLLIPIGCSAGDSHSVTPTEAVKQGVVVADYGVVGNVERLDAFLKQAEQLQGTEQNGSDPDAKVRIARFTKEGDPVYIDLHFDNGRILILTDSSGDQNGGGTSRNRCRQMTTLQNEQGLHYLVTGCEYPVEQELLVIPSNR